MVDVEVNVNVELQSGSDDMEDDKPETNNESEEEDVEEQKPKPVGKPTKRGGDGEDDKPTSDNTQSTNKNENDDDDNVLTACFDDEGKMGIAWVLFVVIYWTMTVWITFAVTREFDLTIIPWCLGLICAVGMGLSIKSGSYPSGATSSNPNTTKGKGRWAAFGLSAIMSIDLIVLVFVGMATGTNFGDLFRGLGHFFGLLWATLFFYNRFHDSNPDIATQAFFMEWADVLLTIVVIWILNFDKYSGDKEGCFNHRICGVYGVFVILQLLGWIWPMMVIEGWGSQKGAPGVAIHLMFLDIFTDLPVVIAILSIPNVSYRGHWIIFVDVICKSLGLVRSLSYYAVYYIWLKQGKILPSFIDKNNTEEEEVR